MTKKSKQKFDYLENEKSFLGEIKSIFYLFYRVFKCQKLSQTLEWAFNYFGICIYMHYIRHEISLQLVYVVA